MTRLYFIFGAIIALSSFKDTTKYEKLTNIENLILRPPILRYIRLKNSHASLVTYKKSQFRKFPKWISNYKKLKAIDLIGNPLFHYEKELIKISKLDKLEYLAIEKNNLNDTLFQQIILLKNLKQLHIKKSFQDKDSLFVKKINKTLPNCKVGISSYADYADIYFSKRKK